MSKNKKDRLLLNLLEGEKHKHRVAMVNDEGAFNQHEPNSNMARMFVVMLLIHVVVIGGIIIYDWVSGEEAPRTHAATSSSLEHSAAPASALPPPAVDAAMLDREMPIEEFATYEWKSGDSIPSVAKKLNVTEDVLIKLNMLDRGTQLDQHSILRYPKRPLVKAVGIGVAGANGELPQPPPPTEGLTGAHAPMNLTGPKEQTFAFAPDISNELTPAPTIIPGQKIEDSPPAATSREASGTPVVKKDTPKIAEAPPAAPKSETRQPEKVVPKAIPVTRQTAEEKAPAKKVADAPPAKKAAPAPVAKTTTRSRSHVVKPGETLYSIATKNGISVKSLQQANKVVRPEALRDGMTLVIPGK